MTTTVAGDNFDELAYLAFPFGTVNSNIRAHAF